MSNWGTTEEIQARLDQAAAQPVSETPVPVEKPVAPVKRVRRTRPRKTAAKPGDLVIAALEEVSGTSLAEIVEAVEALPQDMPRPSAIDIFAGAPSSAADVSEIVERRAGIAPEQAALVAAVRAHAIRNYNRSGWDIVVETMTDEDIAALLGKARTEQGAIKVVLDHVLPAHQMRQEIIAAGE